MGCIEPQWRNGSERVSEELCQCKSTGIFCVEQRDLHVKALYRDWTVCGVRQHIKQTLLPVRVSISGLNHGGHCVGGLRGVRFRFL